MGVHDKMREPKKKANAGVRTDLTTSWMGF
jgi:hypothetical protein